MTDAAAARVTLRLAVGTLLATALAGAWEVLVSQAPGSPLYQGLLPGPVQALRELSLTLGVLVFLAALAWGRVPAGPASIAPKSIVVGLHLGSICAVGASFYAATQGMRGEQLYDLRPDGAAVFVGKYVGLATVSVSLAALGKRVLARVDTHA